MKKFHNSHGKELHLFCPIYKENAEPCPSSKNRLDEESFLTLVSVCTTTKHKTCKVFLEFKSKSQAA